MRKMALVLNLIGFGKGILFGSGILISFFLFGCKGVPTGDETKARESFSSVSNAFRPSEHRPVLPELTPHSSLSNYLEFAVLNHPDVEAAYYDWNASIERITVSRSFPDPKLTFQADIMDSITSLMPGLMMDLPGPGKRHAAAAVASAVSEVKYHTFQMRVLQAAFDLKQAYYRFYLLDSKIRVNHQVLDLLTELEKLARVQNESGKRTLQDVLKAQIEEERLRTEIENLEDSRHYLMSQFKAALGMSSESSNPPVPMQFEMSADTATLKDVLPEALARSPKIKAMEAEVRQAEASLALAGKARIPDFGVGLEADAKSSPVLYRPQFSSTLPIWRDKLRAQLMEAQAGKKAAQARLSNEQINLAVGVAEKSFLFRENSRNLSLLSERLLPKAHQAMEIARAGYLSGQSDFLSVIDAERTLLEFELMEAESRSEREINLAEISLMLVGLPPEGSLLSTSISK